MTVQTEDVIDRHHYPLSVADSLINQPFEASDRSRGCLSILTTLLTMWCNQHRAAAYHNISESFAFFSFNTVRQIRFFSNLPPLPVHCLSHGETVLSLVLSA